MFYAHTCPNGDWEPLRDHLERTAASAERFASVFGQGPWARLAGLWHDLGKYSEAFQAYLRAAADPGEGVHQSEMKGRVDHSTAGAQHASAFGVFGQMLAYCIAGHHAGLPDHVDGDSSLSERLKKTVERIDAAPAELLRHPMPPAPSLRCGEQPRAFVLAFFTRMLFSCLVDADFLETERVMNPARSDRRPVSVPLPTLLERLDAHLETLQGGADETPVNRHRREVLRACRAKAALPPGFFSLNVPTGGGKTLSSLAFALEHAKAHGMGRVVYAIPFTSIVEQTASVFREALGDLASEVLEHHSNLDPGDPERQTDRSRLAAENFDAPLIVTTNVQLFESLFAVQTSRCRKLHRLARSVIILDEAQALPPNLLEPTLVALRELVSNYGATVLICTATQPAIERRDDFPIGLSGVRPIVDEPARLHDGLRRTTVERIGGLSNDELADRIRREPRVLCIVNSRKHAAALFEALGDPEALHLSASMCGAHRAAVIDEMRRRLAPGDERPCRVVSTQVIEAGVDVDFPVVYRAAAGLDAIAQAAGRCNREGRLTDDDGRPRPGRVFVFDVDPEAFRTVPLITRATNHFREVAPDYDRDLLAPDAIEAYFRLHYWHQGGHSGRGWDRGREGRSIMKCFDYDGRKLHAQFRKASSAYRLIDDAQIPIVVPFGDRGRGLIARLRRMPEAPDPEQLRDFDREAQRFVVGVFEKDLRKLLQNGVLVQLHDRFVLGNSEAYDDRLGVRHDVLGLDTDMLLF